MESSLKPEQSAMYYGDGGVGANSIISKALTTPTRSTSEMVLGIQASLLTSPLDVQPTWAVSFLTSVKIYGKRFAS